MNESGALLAVALDQESMMASLREQEERLRRAALYDQLTGLPNRSLFYDRLTMAIRRAQRQPLHGYAVLFLDLDGFKAVNDTLGHAAGDELLVQVAGRIRAGLRPPTRRPASAATSSSCCWTAWPTRNSWLR
jgi:GGDEF domain-containing protein